MQVRVEISQAAPHGQMDGTNVYAPCCQADWYSVHHATASELTVNCKLRHGQRRTQ